MLKLKSKLFFIGFFIIVVNIFSQTPLTTESIFNEDLNVLLVEANEAYKEGKIQESIDLLFRVWQSQRNGFGLLLTIAEYYNELNNPEMSGIFLLEAIKRSPTIINSDTFQDRFSNVWNQDSFIQYKTEALSLNEKRINDRGDYFYMEISTLIGYRVILPPSFNSERAYPIVIYLHDDGRFPTEWLDEQSDLYKTNGIVLIVPNAPFAMSFSHLIQTCYYWSIPGYNLSENKENKSNYITQKYLEDLTIEVRKKFKVASIYLSGCGESALYALNIGLSHQNMFDGIICFGTIPITIELEQYSNKTIPILLFSEDETLNIYQQLKNSKFNVDVILTNNNESVGDETFQAIQWVLNKN